MRIIVLDNDTDFEGWRKAARRLALNDVKPAEVTWTVRKDDELSSTSCVNDLPDAPQARFNVTAVFVELAKTAILHRNDERFALLYRLIWRLRSPVVHHRDRACHCVPASAGRFPSLHSAAMVPTD